MLKTLFIPSIAMTLFLSACSMTPPKNMMDVQAGEKFVLNKPLVVGQGQGRAFIQFGKEIKKSELDRYEQHCSVEVDHLPEKEYIIQPESFTITKVRLDMVQIVQKEHRLPLLAFNETSIQSDAWSFNMNFASSGNGDGQPDPTYDAVYFFLQSPDKQNIYRLTCMGSLSNGNPLDAPRSYRPQRNQVNKILGSIGQIQQ